MNNKFMIGDMVVCKAGGPLMVVQTAPVVQNVLAAPGNVLGNFNLVPNRYYSCVWWNPGVNMFSTWSFHEDMLDDAPTP
jgi:uncharacterized protein YodC (DUF2158 family)